LDYAFNFSRVNRVYGTYIELDNLKASLKKLEASTQKAECPGSRGILNPWLGWGNYGKSEATTFGVPWVPYPCN
jgi:hypothetical protein